MSLQVTNSSVAYTGKPIALDATLVDYDGNEVDKSCYTLCYSDKHLNKLDGVPVECGEYYVNAREIAGSGYVGQANSYYRVNIVDTTDISYFNFYINQNVVVGGTEPTFNSSLYFLNENGESVSIDLNIPLKSETLLVAIPPRFTSQRLLHFRKKLEQEVTFGACNLTRNELLFKEVQFSNIDLQFFNKGKSVSGYVTSRS